MRKLAVIGVILRIRSQRRVPLQRIRLVLTAIEIRAVENRISKSIAFPGHGFTDRSGCRSGGLSRLCRANDSRNTESRTSHRVGSRICNNLAVAAGDNDPRSGNYSCACGRGRQGRLLLCHDEERSAH